MQSLGSRPNAEILYSGIEYQTYFCKAIVIQGADGRANAGRYTDKRTGGQQMDGLDERVGDYTTCHVGGRKDGQTTGEGRIDSDGPARASGLKTQNCKPQAR